MKESMQREAARLFAAEWTGHGYDFVSFNKKKHYHIKQNICANPKKVLLLPQY